MGKGGEMPSAAKPIAAPVRTRDERVQAAGDSERERARRRASLANTRLTSEGGFSRSGATTLA